MQQKDYIEFISRLANLLAEKISPSTTTIEVSGLFKTYLGVRSVDIVIWDNKNMLLKDFICNWKLFDDEEQIRTVNYIFLC